MNKGQTKEMINFAILIIGITITFVISYFLIFSPQQKSERLLIEYHTYNRILNAVNDFYYSKISGTEVSLAKFMADRIILNENPIYYGDGYPYIDVDNMTMKFFDSYFDDRWHLRFPLHGTTESFELGHEIPKLTTLQTFELQLPTPTDNFEIIRGYLYVWAE
jgi:hypothetical protein